ncbi:hypothetical protein SD71_18265 [Cohnella kolymensis]|uniref:Transposase DDE domain-containing protein n=1 Tax=Cohnella kolymensis TaxID=1590652 RepID=A0ABR5A0W5_9BACL|nr:hypothetical protein SD71_18265 [Cohnella kolymensis]
MQRLTREFSRISLLFMFKPLAAAYLAIRRLFSLCKQLAAAYLAIRRHFISCKPLATGLFGHSRPLHLM